jgi:alkyl hydroperoxide reductase subunit AhpC
VAPDATIRWACAHDLRVGRNVDEVLRVLAALQAGGLCRCGWEPGDPFLEVDDGG